MAYQCRCKIGPDGLLMYWSSHCPRHGKWDITRTARWNLERERDANRIDHKKESKAKGRGRTR